MATIKEQLPQATKVMMVFDVNDLKMQAKTIVSSEDTQIIMPDNGYAALSSVRIVSGTPTPSAVGVYF